LRLYFSWDWSGLQRFVHWSMPCSIAVGALLTLVNVVAEVRETLRMARVSPFISLPAALCRTALLTVVACSLFTLSIYPFASRLMPRKALDQAYPTTIREFYNNYHNWYLVSSYGLFASMTTERPEIELRASMDGTHWEPYVYHYKPGPLDRRPPVVVPHQPRVDWQMWFAALGRWEQQMFLFATIGRLLEGSKPVMALFEHMPFDGQTPKYIGAMKYQYRFTSIGDSDWWKRTHQGESRVLCMCMYVKRNTMLTILEQVLICLGIGPLRKRHH
jgi:hypothetical protein